MLTLAVSPVRSSFIGLFDLAKISNTDSRFLSFSLGATCTSDANCDNGLCVGGQWYVSYSLSYRGEPKETDSALFPFS